MRLYKFYANICMFPVKTEDPSLQHCLHSLETAFPLDLLAIISSSFTLLGFFFFFPFKFNRRKQILQLLQEKCKGAFLLSCLQKQMGKIAAEMCFLLPHHGSGISSIHSSILRAA